MWFRSREAVHFFWLIIDLRRRRIDLPAAHIANFLIPLEIVGVVWTKRFDHCPKLCYLELFEAVSSRIVFRVGVEFPDDPVAQLQAVAISDEFSLCAALFHSPDNHLKLVLSSLDSLLFLPSFDIGEGDDPFFPTCDVAFATIPSRKLVCAGGGHVRMFAIESNGLLLLWQLADVWPKYVAFVHNDRLAYVGERVNEPQLRVLSVDSGSTLSHIWFPADMGCVDAMACAPHSNLLTLAFKPTEQNLRDMPPTKIYQWELVPGQEAATENILSDNNLYALLYAGGTSVISMSRTPRYLIVGTCYGHVHIVDETSHRVFIGSECVGSFCLERASTYPLVLRTERDTLISFREARGVMMLWHGGR